MHLYALAAILLSTLCLTSAYALSPEDEFTAAGCPDTTSPYASHSDQLAAWEDFTSMLYNEKRITEAFDKYVAAGYINHSPLVPGNGANTTIAELSQIVPNVNSDLQRAYVGWDRNGTAFGTAHTKVTGGGAIGIPDSALVDIIRMVGTCLVEHWDVEQSTEGSHPNPIAFFF
ncbi:hypothetical protein BO70DRAFT_364278 [Aspergillus heteromorphus CBS 117.55]|uniref:SnoaL-like domain-containing protein n=1 Tax=Aspergillus heteromorphus CBS 117.55 TaxID=1448321 RepID=A0A317VMX8_9EURO|nr:uncharacterized protein BO70DRAFT_364278 [Aspergillus heteromorphus CBS 117.55]PWY74288.1 hypothetical protein BO70DRAFT_364278 [Aspergillus heteromorphus CBS 117.55]